MDRIKEYKRKYNQKYGEKNKDRIKEYKRKYYQKNKEKITAKVKAYTLKNKDRIKITNKDYYEKNKDIISEKKAEYYHRNRDERLKYCKDYYEKNKDKAKEYMNKWLSIPLNNVRNKIQSNLNVCLKNYATKGHLYIGNRHKDIDYNAISKHLLNLVDKMEMSYREIRETHHVDHIIPMYYYELEEIHKAFNPLNLRWLPAKENMSRQNNITKQDWEIINTLPKEIYPQSLKENR